MLTPWFDLLSELRTFCVTKYSLYSRQLADSTDAYNQEGEGDFKVLFEALERQVRARLRQISQNNVDLLYFAID